MEYCLTEKGASVVPILRSICQWAGIYRTEDPAHALPQCKKCNYRGEAPGGTGWAGVCGLVWGKLQPNTRPPGQIVRAAGLFLRQDSSQRAYSRAVSR